MPSLSEIRCQIDDEILETEVKLLKLKCRRNQLTPACRLPSEILLSIFMALHDVWSYSPAADRRCHFPIAVSQVCSSWRAVSLSFQPLWNHVEWSSFGPPVGDLVIKRSGQRPLDVLLRMENCYRAATRLTKGVLARTSSLTLEDCPVDLFYDGWDYRHDIGILKHPAPVLESLVMIGHEPAFRDLEIANGFLGNDAPSLRIVHLSAIHIHWTQTKFLRCVRSLSIDKGFIEGGPSDMRSTLTGLIYLENLRLHLEYSRMVGQLQDGPAITLPRLKTLKLTAEGDESSWIASFLRILSAPKLSSCRFEIHHTDAVTLEGVPIFLLRFRDTLVRQGITLRKLMLTAKRVMAWETTDSKIVLPHERLCDSDGTAYMDTPVLDAHIDCGSSWEGLRIVFDAMNFQSVSDVIIKEYMDPKFPHRWEELALLLPSLSELYLEDTMALTSDQEPSSVSHAPPFFNCDREDGPFFLSMTTLKIYRVTDLEAIQIIPWLQFRRQRELGPGSVVICGPRQPEGMDALVQLVEHASFQVWEEPQWAREGTGSLIDDETENYDTAANE
jgi:hypothetical protein